MPIPFWRKILHFIIGCILKYNHSNKNYVKNYSLTIRVGGMLTLIIHLFKKIMIKDNDSNMCNIYYKILVMLKCERLIHIERMRKQSILFLSCTAVVMGLLYQFERKVDFILPIYNLMILSTSPFIIYHFCGIPSSNYCCFPKF